MLNDDELFFGDLAMRVPYGVKLHIISENTDCELTWVDSYSRTVMTDCSNDGYPFKDVKAYLRDITSITDYEILDFVNECWLGDVTEIDRENGTFTVRTVDYDFDEEYQVMSFEGMTHLHYNAIQSIHWLLKHHFDIFGLLYRDLAIVASKEYDDKMQKCAGYYKAKDEIEKVLSNNGFSPGSNESGQLLKELADKWGGI